MGCYPEPTAAPSLAPSPVTSSPSTSSAPTECVRMVCCYDCSCCGPGTSWNQFTDTCVVDIDSITGDDDDTCDYPVPRGQCYDETVSLEEDACGELPLLRGSHSTLISPHTRCTTRDCRVITCPFYFSMLFAQWCAWKPLSRIKLRDLGEYFYT